ncbi:MAG: hypothetical protein SFW65_07935 [Alphaproteobacteria bacterium]|nr:hypothetical protein [Alphaproteobacteria bacterium]
MAAPLEYNGVPVPRTSPLGMMTTHEQGLAHSLASKSKAFDQQVSPQVRLQQALQSNDLTALTQTLMSNPLMLKGNPVAMEQLRNSEFFQRNKKDVLSALNAPDPFNGDAQIPAERQQLISQLEGIKPREAGASREYAGYVPENRQIAARSQFNPFTG